MIHLYSPALMFIIALILSCVPFRNDKPESGLKAYDIYDEKNGLGSEVPRLKPVYIENHTLPLSKDFNRFNDTPVDQLRISMAPGGIYFDSEKVARKDQARTHVGSGIYSYDLATPMGSLIVANVDGCFHKIKRDGKPIPSALNYKYVMKARSLDNAGINCSKFPEFADVNSDVLKIEYQKECMEYFEIINERKTYIYEANYFHLSWVNGKDKAELKKAYLGTPTSFHLSAERLNRSTAAVDSLFLHVDKIFDFIQEGTCVKKGTPIALSGSSGFASGPHTHYQVQIGSQGEPVDSLYRHTLHVGFYEMSGPFGYNRNPEFVMTKTWKSLTDLIEHNPVVVAINDNGDIVESTPSFESESKSEPNADKTTNENRELELYEIKTIPEEFKLGYSTHDFAVQACHYLKASRNSGNPNPFIHTCLRTFSALPNDSEAYKSVLTGCYIGDDGEIQPRVITCSHRCKVAEFGKNDFCTRVR